MIKQFKAFLKNRPFIANLISRNKMKIVGQNNVLEIKGRLGKVNVSIIGNNNRLVIANGAIVTNTNIFMLGDNQTLILAEKVKFKRGDLWMENNGCLLSLGRATTVVQAHLAVTEPGRKIVIGDDCMFSRDIEFRTGDSHSILDLSTGKRINEARDIIVGDHVWVGARVIVLKGVTLGDNSIIGTGSVVTKDVPPHSIVAGVPARVIRDNVSWTRERILQPGATNNSHE